MPKMKHLLRKLHIGGGAATINHNNHNALPDSHHTPSSSTLPSPTVVSDRNPVVDAQNDDDNNSNNNNNNNVFNFNLLQEEEFQMQLALAISASDSGLHRHDSAESAQIDAAKQISLGYAASLTDSQALAQFQSLRYWNYNVIGYDEKVMDGFYDVYGITSNLDERGKMPLLVDLQTAPVSGDVDCEVILVNRVVDAELSRLERRACSLFEECCVSELGMILSGLLQKLADVVVSRMGGPVGNAEKITRRWAMKRHELRDSLGTIVLPLGFLDVGLSRHRALLFKILADRINIPCMLVKGSYYTGTDDGAVNFIKADDGSEYIIDMMGAPGTLIPVEVPSSQLQNYNFSVRGCADIVGLHNNTHSKIDDGTGVPGFLSDCGGISTVGRVQTEDLLVMGSQTKPDEINHVRVNETGTCEHTEAYTCSLNAEPSPAENMRVKNVSKYVLSAAQDPEFAQKLHNVLVESGALPPPDLFSGINPQDKGVNKVHEKVVDTAQADLNILLLSYEKSLIPSHRVGSASDTWLCQSTDQLAERQKELHTDAIEFYNSSWNDNTRNGYVTVSDRDNDLEQSYALNIDSVSINSHKMRKEKCPPESSLPKTALSCKRHDGIDCFCDDDENGPRNKVGASFNNTELGNDSAVQINETGVNGDCVLNDGKNIKVNPA